MSRTPFRTISRVFRTAALAGAMAALSGPDGARGAGADAPKPPELRLPAQAAPTGYRLDLSIDPGQTTFTGAADVGVRLEAATDFFWMHGADLEIRKITATAGGKSVAVAAAPAGTEFLGIRFERPVGPGTVDLHIEYTGRLDETSTQGVFRQKDGEDWYAYTQLETTDARRAFPGFDEPSYKVPFQLTLRIPKGTTAVSNTPIASEADGPGGTRVVRFRQTEPLPSYLVAFGVGPFDVVNAGRWGRGKTPIRILTPRGKAAQARYAKDTSGPLLVALEEYFGMPFPYAKLDQLAIPQTVTFGAMENAGLITWSERILLATPSEETPAWQRAQAEINAHEIAHQWFGDLVTLAWWNDVWLNESFATWMADRTIAEWKPEWKSDVSRVVARAGVMEQDTLVNARKIRQEIRSNDDIVNAFDGISYQKGGAVIAMFESWIGPEKFRAGVRRYLDAHRHGTATSADFLQALEAASRPGVAAAFSSFLDQPGVPLVEVSLDCADGKGTLTLTQQRLLPVGSKGAPGQTWQVPVCVSGEAGGREGRACTLLTGKTATMAAPPSGACPAWIDANDRGAGYYSVLYRGDLFAKLLGAADRKLTVAERVNLIRDVGGLAGAGALPVSDALRLVTRFADDPAREVVEATMKIATETGEHLVSTDLAAPWSAFVTKSFGPRARALGFTAKPGEDEDTRLLRTKLVPFVAQDGDDPALRAEARRLAEAWFADHRAIPADMVGGVLEAAARHGDRDFYEKLKVAARAEKNRRDRMRILATFGSFADPAIAAEAIPWAMSGDFDVRELYYLPYQARQTEAGRAALWDFVRENYDPMVARMPREVTGVLPFFASGFCDPRRRAEVAEFFRGRAEELPGGSRNLALTLEGTDLCIALRGEQDPRLRQFLNE